MPLEECFMKDMENFFKQIEDEEKVREMRQFKHKDFEKIATDKAEEEMSKEQVKYAEKVKSYSKYLIGRKLSKNVQPFLKT